MKFFYVNRVVYLLALIVLSSSCGLEKNKQDDSDKSTSDEIEQKIIVKPNWFESRMAYQKEKAIDLKVFKDFSFSNSLIESGITFEHKINPDCKIHFHPNHYDHGNGIAVADVDGDDLLDVFFVSQVGSAELWKNSGDGKFQNITSKSGLDKMLSKTNISASFADIDNDGDSDLYVTCLKEGNYLFENDGKGNFKDISRMSMTDHKGHSSGSIFFDYNLDGLLDLLVTNVGMYTTFETEEFIENGKEYSYYKGMVNSFLNHHEPNKFENSVLFKNKGDNIFQNVTTEMGLTSKSWSGDASMIDANNDGYLDLYLTNMQGKDVYYENQKGKNFIDKTEEIFPMTPMGTMGIKVFDFDNNGSQDLFLTDMHSDMIKILDYDENGEKIKFKVPAHVSKKMGAGISGNAFFKKSDKDSYKEISDAIGVENYWPWGVSVGDLNADGFEDMFITTSMNYPFRYQSNSLMLNNQGTDFVDVAFVLGVEPRKDGSHSKPWFDLDCSVEGVRHRECENISVPVTIWGSQGSRSSVFFDMDNDGDLDIITNEFNDAPMILESNLSDQNPDLKYVEIKLVGTKSNRSGIGSIVTLTTKSGSQHKVYDGKSGYLSQSDYPLYFGLADDNKVEKINVQWPSGIKQEVTKNIEINQLMTIREPS